MYGHKLDKKFDNGSVFQLSKDGKIIADNQVYKNIMDGHNWTI